LQALPQLALLQLLQLASALLQVTLMMLKARLLLLLCVQLAAA
jgi:hypothetical protein